MESKKSLLYSQTLNKKHGFYAAFGEISRSMGYEVVQVNTTEQALKHLLTEKSGLLFCDDALFDDKFVEQLGEIQEGTGIVVINTKPADVAPSLGFVDAVLVLSLPEKLLGLTLTSIYKHMLLKSYLANVSNTVNPEFLTKLLSDTAHAVNNILSGMQGYAELAQLNPDDAKLIQDSFNVVLFSSQRVKQEIKNLRALVRVENPDRKPVNIMDVLETAVDLSKNQITARNIHLKYGMESRAMVNADSDQLIQVFYNLLNDVVSNVSDGGTISLGIEEVENRLYVKFIGDHYGLSDAEFASYENIFSLDVPIIHTEDEEGKIDYRGILSICNRIVVKHGGTVVLAKIDKDEVLYTVTLPMMREEEKRAAMEEMLEEAVGANINDLDMDILVVDDEEYVRNTIYYFFDKKGCRVTVAEDGEFGFNIAKTKPFDLIFMDFLMPKMGGIESARKIIENNKNVKIVFITGRESLNEDDLYKAGIYACVRKPFEMKELFDIAKRIAYQKGVVD
jgi:CheY-like chemotaxis protein